MNKNYEKTIGALLTRDYSGESLEKLPYKDPKGPAGKCERLRVGHAA